MVSLPDSPIESHATHRDRMLEHAEAMCNAGDRLQASEKIWGAVAHGLKAVADEREWPYRRHQDGVVIARYVGALAGDAEIATLFRAVESFHRNFYADAYSIEDIRQGVDEAKRFLSRLDAARERIPADAPMPDDREYRRRLENDARRSARTG